MILHQVVRKAFRLFSSDIPLRSCPSRCLIKFHTGLPHRRNDISQISGPRSRTAVVVVFPKIFQVAARSPYGQLMLMPMTGWLVLLWFVVAAVLTTPVSSLTMPWWSHYQTWHDIIWLYPSEDSTCCSVDRFWESWKCHVPLSSFLGAGLRLFTLKLLRSEQVLCP